MYIIDKSTEDRGDRDNLQTVEARLARAAIAASHHGPFSRVP